jgi:hypothetical protein
VSNQRLLFGWLAQKIFPFAIRKAAEETRVLGANGFNGDDSHFPLSLTLTKGLSWKHEGRYEQGAQQSASKERTKGGGVRNTEVAWERLDSGASAKQEGENGIFLGLTCFKCTHLIVCSFLLKQSALVICITSGLVHSTVNTEHSQVLQYIYFLDILLVAPYEL